MNIKIKRLLYIHITALAIYTSHPISSAQPIHVAYYNLYSAYCSGSFQKTEAIINELMKSNTPNLSPSGLELFKFHLPYLQKSMVNKFDFTFNKSLSDEERLYFVESQLLQRKSNFSFLKEILLGIQSKVKSITIDKNVLRNFRKLGIEYKKLAA